MSESHLVPSCLESFLKIFVALIYGHVLFVTYFVFLEGQIEVNVGEKEINEINLPYNYWYS